MKFTMTATFPKRWTIRFLRCCLFCFVTYCVLVWKWKGLGVAFENHDVAAIDNLLIGGLMKAIGVSIGILWPKITFRRSNGDGEIAANGTDVARTNPAV
jgi:hypothetical protein